MKFSFVYGNHQDQRLSLIGYLVLKYKHFQCQLRYLSAVECSPLSVFCKRDTSVFEKFVSCFAERAEISVSS
jgi:hypothetical protein